MKIYGNKNEKRGIKVGEITYREFNNKTSAIGFITDHGLLGEYISKMDGDEEIIIDVDPENISMSKLEYNGETYWYGTNVFDEMLTLKIDRMVGFYKELPDIYDDNIFHWKKNKKYGTRECIIEESVFEYHCIYKSDGNATIDVKYTACDNRHRNKVTISTIEVEYASNSVLKKAIKTWKKNFKNILEVA